MMFQKLERPSNLCGECSRTNPCDCSCHDEPLVMGFHEVIRSPPLELPKISEEFAYATGQIFDKS